jgi:hypothetical protein
MWYNNSWPLLTQVRSGYLGSGGVETDFDSRSNWCCDPCSCSLSLCLLIEALLKNVINE